MSSEVPISEVSKLLTRPGERKIESKIEIEVSEESFKKTVKVCVTGDRVISENGCSTDRQRLPRPGNVLPDSTWPFLSRLYCGYLSAA